MSCNSPLSLLVCHIRNAIMVEKKSTVVPFSKLNTNVCEFLKNNGFISAFETLEESKGIKTINIHLKYQGSKSAIEIIKLESKPGKRIYSGYRNIQPFFNKLGTKVISTSSGLVSDSEAKKRKLGGEVLLSVF